MANYHFRGNVYNNLNDFLLAYHAVYGKAFGLPHPWKVRGFDIYYR